MRDLLAELALETAEHENTKHAYRQALALALAMAGQASYWHRLALKLDLRRSELAHADAARDRSREPIPETREAA